MDDMENDEVEQVVVTRIEPTTITSDRIAMEINSMANADSLTIDQIGESKNLIDLLDEFVKAAKAQWKLQAIRFIELGDESGFSLGDMRYYIGADTKIKCRDVLKTLQTANAVTEGKLDQIAKLLSTNAFKPGECKKFFANAGVADTFDELFEKVEVKKLKALPGPQLQTINTRFLK